MIEDDDKQVYFTKETWDVLERLENAGFCKPRERFHLARIAIAIALARGLEVSPDEMKGRESHYQLDVLEPLRDVVLWRYPEEKRLFWRMSNLAQAGCEFLRDNAQELDGNIPFIELITEDFDTEIEPWIKVDRSVEDEDQTLS
jgi:hypothetical protein